MIFPALLVKAQSLPPFLLRIVYHVHANNGANEREAEKHRADNGAIPQATERTGRNAIEKFSCLLRRKDWCLSLINDIFWPAHGGWIDIDDVARHQVIEQHPNRSKVLLCDGP